MDVPLYQTRPDEQPWRSKIASAMGGSSIAARPARTRPGQGLEQQKTALRRFLLSPGRRRSISARRRKKVLQFSALTRLEAWVRLADHEDLAATTNHLAVAVTGLR
jgi:hypothetical protein